MLQPSEDAPLLLTRGAQIQQPRQPGQQQRNQAETARGLTCGVEDKGCGERAAEKCCVDGMLKVLERSVGAKSLDPIAVGHGRADFDHVFDGFSIEEGRRTEKHHPGSIHRLPARNESLASIAIISWPCVRIQRQVSTQSVYLRACAVVITCGFVLNISLSAAVFGCARALAAAEPTKEVRSMSGVLSGIFTQGVSSMLSRFFTESVRL